MPNFSRSDIILLIVPNSFLKYPFSTNLYFTPIHAHLKILVENEREWLKNPNYFPMHLVNLSTTFVSYTYITNFKKKKLKLPIKIIKQI